MIRSMTAEVDPESKNFRIEDTGLDVEVILTVQGGEGDKDFDKGDGVVYLDSILNFNLANSMNLICGDTGSDVPMVTKTI